MVSILLIKENFNFFKTEFKLRNKKMKGWQGGYLELSALESRILEIYLLHGMAGKKVARRGARFHFLKTREKGWRDALGWGMTWNGVL